jgi:curved DNA-binding protein CbpA
MTDYFALLDVPRRPWLDPDSLKEKYLTLSGKLHPDRAPPDASDPRGAHDRYTEINSAYHSLLGPRERLSHLLQLELGTHASRTFPPIS